MAYGAKDISILKGLQPVRERPGMYIGSTGPSGLHHLVYEVVDNSVDEALAGYATRIDVTLLADGGCRVVDNGRGIPVDPHPEYPDKSAAEIVLTMLHAGGKFGGEGYKISGGLHGVGVSVVNALSRRLELEIDRDGGRYEHDVRRRRRARPGRSSASATPTRTGTTVTFWPDPTIMEEVEFRAQTLLERLREMAFLNKGLEIVFRDERADEPTEQIFKYDGGIVDFVAHLNASKEPLFATVDRRSSDTYDARRGRDRDAVEHRLLRGPPLVREQHRHHRRRDARRGLQEGPHQRGEPVRRARRATSRRRTRTSSARTSARASPRSSR